LRYSPGGEGSRLKVGFPPAFPVTFLVVFSFLCLSGRVLGWFARLARRFSDFLSRRELSCSGLLPAVFSQSFYGVFFFLSAARRVLLAWLVPGVSLSFS